MTETEKLAIEKQMQQLTYEFGVPVYTEPDYRTLTPSVVTEIKTHLRVMSMHTRRKWSLATVTALLFFGIQMPAESKAEPRAKAEAAP